MTAVDPAAGDRPATLDELGGEHCETASLRKMLHHAGLDIDEALLLGLGGGIGFMYAAPTDQFPGFVGGRNGPFPAFTQRMLDGVGLQAGIVTTDDPARAESELISRLATGDPAVCYGDLFYLPYFQASRHFGAHAFVVTSVTPQTRTATVSDRCRIALSVGLDDLAAARGSGHQPFPPRHAVLSADWTQARPPGPETVRERIRGTAAALRAPAPSVGLAGLRAMVTDLVGAASHEPAPQLVDRLTSTFIDLELAGTGGAAFRSLYCTFLAHAAEITADRVLVDAHDCARTLVTIWGAALDALLPRTGALGAVRTALVDREAAWLAGAADDHVRARNIAAQLPSLKQLTAMEINAHREDIAAAIRDRFTAVINQEHELLALLGRV
ncbi:MAG: BtrH N-terminal domain-containing protein [Pseudonocardiaceae bacterium]